MLTENLENNLFYLVRRLGRCQLLDKSNSSEKSSSSRHKVMDRDGEIHYVYSKDIIYTVLQ